MWADLAVSADVPGETAPIERPGRSRAIGTSWEHRVPEAARQPERLAVPKRRLDAVSQDIVLSPRVIDRLAFDEYVALLRAEVENATKESELLARRAEAGAIILEQLDRFIDSNGETIEHAAEVLAGIDERMAASRKLLDDVDRRATNLHKASQQAEQVIEARAEAFEQRLRSIVDAAMDRFEDTEDQLTARAASARRELLDRLEQMRSRGEATIARLDSKAGELSEEAEETVARAQSRLDALREPVRELLGSIESKAAALAAGSEEHAARLIAEAEAGAAKIESAAAAVEQRLDDLSLATTAATETERAVREAAEALGLESRELAEAALAELKSEAASVVEASASSLEQAVALHQDAIRSGVEDARTAESSLRAASTSLTKTAASDDVRRVVELCGQIESLTSQTDAARATLADAIVEGAERIDGLAERGTRLGADARRESDRLESLMADLGAIGDDSLVERIASAVRAEVERETRDELEMATASLAALAERVRVLESNDATLKKPSTRKSTAKKPASKAKTSTKATAAKRATAKPAAKSTETKPTKSTKAHGARARSAPKPEPEVKPTTATEKSSEPSSKPAA
ncbi:MAG: hypothetical protein AAFR76_05575 [Planctomycetota bacterium]